MIVAPTEIFRATIAQEARVVVPPLGMKVNLARVSLTPSEFDALRAKNLAPRYFIPDAGARIGASAPLLRKIQVLVPPSPSTSWANDTLPEEIGPNRLYKIAPFPSGQTIKFDLAPWQWLIAGAVVGLAHCSLVVEYVPLSNDLGAFRKDKDTP